MNTTQKRNPSIDVDYPFDSEKLTFENYEFTDNVSFKTKLCENQVNKPELKTERQIVTNIQSVVPISENVQISCDQCDKSFMSRGSLRTHISFKHDGIDYPCSKCNYKATTKGLIRVHIRAVHEGIRFPCSKCEFTATFK